jgi:hypothetical protein
MSAKDERIAYLERWDEGRRQINVRDHEAMRRVIGRLEYIIQMAVVNDSGAVDSYAHVLMSTPTLIEMRDLLASALSAGLEDFRCLDRPADG